MCTEQSSFAEDAPDADSLFEQALRVTEGLPDQTAPAFGGVRALYSLVLGMIYTVAERLIEAKVRGRATNAPDEALIRLCNRLFNESFAGYVVLSHGLLGAGQHHLRAAVETVNLATLFMEKPECAERWLRGKQYSPGEVRKLIDASEELREWYLSLSTMVHANSAASVTSVFPIDEDTELLRYGGYEAPRTMASTAVDFVWPALIFLRLFYLHYSERLNELSLLWPPEVASAAGESGLTWDDWLDFLAVFAQQVQDEVLALPEDDV